MRISPLLAAIGTAVLLALPTSAATAGEAKLVTKPSAHSVSKTLDRLSGMLKSKGITIFARVDHAAGAKKAGLELPPTELLIFGNPKLGTPLMQSNRAIGADLPMKALAWEDKDGKVYLSYTAPAALKARYAIGDKDKVFQTMTGALGKFTDAATKAE
ncbi:MAG: DUF302 domain-containing protein [Pseudomonadota bacterium]